jgi:hypothetical protein
MATQALLLISALVPIVTVSAAASPPTSYGNRWGAPLDPPPIGSGDRWGAPLGLEVHPLTNTAEPIAGPVAPTRRRRWQMSNSTAVPRTVSPPRRLTFA